MRGLYPELGQEAFPLEFWKIEDDDLFMEVLGYLPLHMGVTDAGVVPGLDEMPEGYRLALPIFWIEDDYFINGWTALTNAGEWLLPSAICAYERIGMKSEANALRAALVSCQISPNDDEAVEAAYKSVDNPYSDDELKHRALRSYFCSNRRLFAPT